MLNTSARLLPEQTLSGTWSPCNRRDRAEPISTVMVVCTSHAAREAILAYDDKPFFCQGLRCASPDVHGQIGVAPPVEWPTVMGENAHRMGSVGWLWAKTHTGWVSSVGSQGQGK